MDRNGVMPSLDDVLKGSLLPQQTADTPLDRLPIAPAGVKASIVGRSPPQKTNIVQVVNENGVSFPIDLSQLTPDKVARVMAPAHASRGNADDTLTALYKLAKDQQDNVVAVTRETARARPRSAPQPAVVVGRPASGPVNAVPVSSLSGYTDQGERGGPPNLIPAPLPDTVGPPTVAVTYEVPGYGPLEALYHQVIRKDKILVLVFDRRHYGPTGFPRQAAVHLGLTIHGTDKIFMVDTTGVQFDLDVYSVCLLKIVREGSLQAYQSAVDPLAQQMSQIPFPEVSSDDGEVRPDRSRLDPPREIPASFKGLPGVTWADTDHDDVPGL